MMSVLTINNASVWSKRADYHSIKNSCFQLFSIARRVAVPALAILAIAGSVDVAMSSCTVVDWEKVDSKEVISNSVTCITETAKCVQTCDCLKENPYLNGACIALCSAVRIAACYIKPN